MNTTTEFVSASAIAGMVLSMIVTLLGPIILLIVWKVKKKCSLLPALAGALTFIIAALVLESIPKYFLFADENAVSGYILSHSWAYSLIGALLAGVFEECGRYVTMRFFLKKHSARKDAISYGIGHGGIECVLLIGFGMLSNLMLAFAINNGTIDLLTNGLPADQAAVYESVVVTLTTAGPGMFLWSIWERFFTLIFHISMSVLVFASVKIKGRIYFFPIAVLLHTAVDLFAAFYQFGSLPLAVTELAIAVFSVGTGVLAYRIYSTILQKYSV